MMTIKESFHLHPIFFDLVKATIDNFYDNQAWVKIITGN
jgi:hypothetical protein